MVPKRVNSYPVNWWTRKLANPERDRDGKVIRHKIQGEACATREAIGAAVDAAVEFAYGYGLSRRDRDRLCVVAEELVTNVVNHGRAASDSKISYSFEADADAVRISIIDRGAPFDPRQGRPAPSSPRRAREGGWGWPMILSWCRVEDYRREEDQNHLLLKMPVEPKDLRGHLA